MSKGLDASQMIGINLHADMCINLHFLTMHPASIFGHKVLS